jgi:hypothetical protein
MDPKYPDIEVPLTGQDGNGFFIIGRVGMALRKAGVDQAEVTEFRKEAMSGDYDHLLQTCMRWVSVS